MLHSPWESHRPHYDYVVVGSGYGGAITSARLAGTEVNGSTAASFPSAFSSAGKSGSRAVFRITSIPWSATSGTT
jgi:hypothetical protein